MSTTGNLVKWLPPISEKPSPEETALHTRLLFNAVNDHDQAITLLHGNVTAAAASAAATASIVNNQTVTGVTAFNTITGSVIYFPSLGFVNDQLGNLSYMTVQGDSGQKIIVGDSTPVTVFLDSSMSAPWFAFIDNDSSTIASLVPSSGSSVYGATQIAAGGSGVIFFDGTNFWAGASPGNITKVSSQWLDSYSASTGVFTQSQPAFSDISGVASYPQIPKYPYTAQTSNYAVQAFDYQIECTANSFTVTLPTAVGITGTMYSIKNSGTGTITVATTSSQTIDGSLTQPLTQYDNLVVMSNGANWLVV